MPEAVSRAVVSSDTWDREEYEDGKNPRCLPLCVRPDGSGAGLSAGEPAHVSGTVPVTDAAKHAHRSCHTEDETVCAGLRALNDGAGSGVQTISHISALRRPRQGELRQGTAKKVGTATLPPVPAEGRSRDLHHGWSSSHVGPGC